uniref:tRNA-dihydrouridine synthase n=1 Tax=Rhizophora mucronata TaxID=61149 RepID=A0A2P2LER3_RHIMU
MLANTSYFEPKGKQKYLCIKRTLVFKPLLFCEDTLCHYTSNTQVPIKGTSHQKGKPQQFFSNHSQSLLSHPRALSASFNNWQHPHHLHQHCILITINAVITDHAECPTPLNNHSQ